MGASRNCWVLLIVVLLLCPEWNPLGNHSTFTCANPLETAAAEDSDDPWAEPRTLADPFGQKASSIEQPLVEGASASKDPAPKSQLRFGQTPWESLTVRSFALEMGILAFCVIYIVTVFVGGHINARLVKAWAREFCLPEGLFHKNFAVVGVGEGKPPLSKLGASEFRLHCSGRKHCKFLEATLKLKPRQDLFALLLGVLFPQDDQVNIEVYMKEASMPQMVMAVATKKLMKAMLKEDGGEDDVRKLTHKLDVGRDKISSWPSDKLVVNSEHSSLFYDIMTDQFVDQIFGQKAFGFHGKYFRLLHFTSEQSYGPKDQRAVLRFSFKLPPLDQMKHLTKLISSVGVFVDVVGNYKLSPDQRKRAEKLRHEVEKKESKEKGKEQQEGVEERRMVKRAEEQEKIKRMHPEQREKYEARKAKVEDKRNQKRFVRKG